MHLGVPGGEVSGPGVSALRARVTPLAEVGPDVRVPRVFGYKGWRPLTFWALGLQPLAVSGGAQGCLFRSGEDLIRVRPALLS